MASAWIRKRPTKVGGARYRVEYRIGGRETPTVFGGSFARHRDADARRKWIVGELAARRVPNVRALEAVAPLTVKAAAARWLASRRDVAPGTASTYRVALARLEPQVGELELAELTPARVNELVEALVKLPLARESVRKTLSVLAMIVDHEAIDPNPVRSPLVKLPRGKRRHVTPPTAVHVLAAHRAILPGYRLPLVVLESTGMRVGELEALTWDDIDEPRGRWRCGHKTEGSLRWVTPPPAVFAAVLAQRAEASNVVELEPGETGQVLDGFGQARFRTALARACRTSGVPSFSPHDLRHRRVSRLHADGVSWARIGELVGHADLVTTARTYTHVVADEAELDYERMVS